MTEVVYLYYSVCDIGSYQPWEVSELSVDSCLPVCSLRVYLSVYMCMQLALFILQRLPKMLIIVGVILWYLYHFVKGCVAAVRQQGVVSGLH